MNYPVRVTHCISLLKSIERYAQSRVYKIDKDYYIEVDTIEEHHLIMQLHKQQELSIKTLNKLSEL
jgi:hypothetical protein